MMSVKSFLINYFNLSEDDYKSFTSWAIGENEHKSPSEVPKIWNERHGDLFRIDGSGDILEDLERMLEAWRNQ